MSDFTPFDEVRPVFVDSLPLSKLEILNAEVDQLVMELKARAGEWANIEHLNASRQGELANRDRIEHIGRDGNSYFRYVYPETGPKAKDFWWHYGYYVIAIALVVAWAVLFLTGTFN